MRADFSLVEGEYLQDILDQPRALDDTVTGLEVTKDLHQLAARLQKGKFKGVVLTGMGSSFHALHPLYVDLIRAGIYAVMVETSELVHYQNRLFDRSHLIMAVSQSGRSAEVVRLLQSNRGRSLIIGITNTPDSPLARSSEACIFTRAGKEYSVSCKTYVTSLIALRWLADLICERDVRRTLRELKSALPSAQKYLAGWKDHVQELCERLRNIRQLFIVGRGSSLAAVGTGALIIKEADHFPAEGMSSAAFRHGPFEMIGHETSVLVFAGERETRDLNRGLFRDIREHQGRAEWIGEDSDFAPFVLPQSPRSFTPLLEILPMEMITLALASQVGREPGRFSLCSKVTTKE
ncbi:MAG TPA: SIS domain-containing protein [Candidatus Binatia bacterium]|nr:SIS domain-containing protein [Candidatus Sulfotelmatobacter sp.]HXJ89616.1 SIS domain-containing protein [Candidatus Binatia bacterium]